MTKDELKLLIDSQAQALKDAVDSLPSGGDEALLQQIAELQGQLASKNDELVAAQDQLVLKDAELLSTKELLAQVDAKAKEIDASIPDA